MEVILVLLIVAVLNGAIVYIDEMLATQEQATLLAELEQTGSIHAALVFRGDSTTAQKFLDEQNKVLEELLAKEAAETEQEAGAEEEIVNDDPEEM